MRKRADPTVIVPKPCGHPVVTYNGQTAPACLWGSIEALAIPSGPEGDALAKAHFEHFFYDWSSGRSILRVRPEMLGPDGQPFNFEDRNGRRRPMWVTG